VTMALFGNNMARTGIDLGTTSVKLVRGTGWARVERFTHAACEPWDSDAADDVERAARALKRILWRHGLGRAQLGRLAVSIGGQDASLREVVLPPLSEAELQQSLPFSARQHLDLEGMAQPVLAGQILGAAAPPPDGGPAPTRALLVASPRATRDFPLAVLAANGLTPDVVDLEPLAGLNALLACPAADGRNGGAEALLDLGARRAILAVSGRDGGLLTREVGPGSPAAEEPAAAAAFADELARRVRETLVFYRGRFRREVAGLALGGGGAALPGLAATLASRLADCVISTLDPFAGLPGLTAPENGFAPVRFVTACGLCRWWDGSRV
jgi:Tfp pilus assembly PilM family ATPase